MVLIHFEVFFFFLVKALQSFQGLSNSSMHIMAGEIPSQIGNLLSLEVLILGTNRLTGHIPDTIFNISTLKTLSVRENHIIGSLPSTMGHGLPNLGANYLGQNNLTGPIPDSISNASSLYHLGLVANTHSQLSGEVEVH